MSEAPIRGILNSLYTEVSFLLYPSNIDFSTIDMLLLSRDTSSGSAGVVFAFAKGTEFQIFLKIYIQ